MRDSRQYIRYWIAGSSIILFAGVLLVVLMATIASSTALAEQRLNFAASSPTIGDGSDPVSPIISKPTGGLNHMLQHVALPRPLFPVSSLATVYAAPAVVVHGTRVGVKSFGGGVFAMMRLPITVTRFVFENDVVSGVIRPASAMSTPEIMPVSTSFVAAKAAVAQAAAPVPNRANTAPQWPIRGAITTLFGAPDWPFQAIHTGIDISDGWRSGVTPVHPFKPGRVIDVEHYGGLGNHVIVDHGGGMTSVYGHMAFTSVRVGEFVDDNSVLGTEGSTGASTGTHLHFEIRINNSPVNPLLYIPGRP